MWAINKKHYTNTSPPIVFKNLVIVGNGVGDRLTYKNDPPGDVRAFDARSGKLVWKFNTIPQRGEFGNNTWDAGSWQFTGHTNVWAPMSLDARARPAVHAGQHAEQRLLRRPTGRGRTCSRSRSSALDANHRQAQSGTTRSSITGCGTTIRHRRPTSSRSPLTASASTRWCNSPNRAGRSCSIA